MAIVENTQFGRVGAFKFWCQKVLPAVYDDSLSYYELLCKVMKWLTDLTDVTNKQSDAITELQETLAQFMEGEFDSYIEEKVDEWFAENEPDILADIADLQDKMDETIAITENFMMNQAPNNLLMGARPIMRIELTQDDYLQGGCPFNYNDVLHYAVCVYSNTLSYCNRVIIYNVATSSIVSTINNNFGHGNMIDYYDGKIYISGDSTSTLVYVYDVSAPSSPTLLNIIDMSTAGFGTLWGFGHYKDGKFWATPDLSEIYTVDSSYSNKTFLCTQPINTYMTGTQQSISYDDEEDVFYSCRSSSYTRFNENHDYTRYFSFDWQYGYCSVYEIEQLSRFDGKLYFHNNTTYNQDDPVKVFTIFMYDPNEQCVQPNYIATRHIFRLKADAQYKIPNFFRSTPTYFYYPEDLRTFLKVYPVMVEDSIVLDTDIDFVIPVPMEVGDVYCNNHKCIGILLEGGNTTIVYGIPAYDSDDVAALVETGGNGNKSLIHGYGVSLIVAGFGATEAAASATFNLFDVFGGFVAKRNDLPANFWTASSSYIVDTTN